MDFVKEQEDLEEALSTHCGATYAFFKLFQVQLDSKADSTGIQWSRGLWDSTLSSDVLLALRSYLKNIRRKLQENTMTPTECRQSMWFWCQKLLELGAFDRSARREILHWADVCNERTLEGCQLRVESVGGTPAFVTVRKETT